MKRNGTTGMRVTAVVALVALAALLLGLVGNTAHAADDKVVVPMGKPIEIAVVVSHSGSMSASGDDAWAAVQMALENHPFIKGFAVQLNNFDGPCDPDPSGPANVSAANAVIANRQNIAVLGHYCSAGAAAALPIYEDAGIVVISGSATRPSLP